MVLQVQNLCKEYPQFSLRDISFQLPEGAIMGLIGENGAGKSTTMRMILGMAQPDSGQISVFGHRGVTPQDRESIGVVFDEMPFNQTLYTSHLGRVMKKIYSQWDESAYNQYLQRFSLPDKKEIKDFSRGDDSGSVQVGHPKGTADFYAGPGRVVRAVCGRGLYPQPSGQRGGNRILLQDGAVGYCRFVPASGFGSAAVDSPLGQDCQQKGVVKISREILDSSSHRMTAAEAAAR